MGKPYQTQVNKKLTESFFLNLHDDCQKAGGDLKLLP
jgi:hypothetical protein